MATRPQTGGSRANLYEVFRPVSQWKEKPESNIVVVHLPGFPKEQINITCINSSRVVLVTGERQLQDNKWSRCNQAFKIPQNCKIDKIYARWFDGALKITMPKETITLPAGARKEEAKPNLQAPKDCQQAASPKTATETKSSKDYQLVTPGKAAETSIVHDEKKIEGRTGDSLIAQKSEKEVKPHNGDRKDDSTFPESASTTIEQTDKDSPVPKAENIDLMKGKERGERTDNIVADSKKLENVKGSAFPETLEKEKEREDKSAEEKQKQKEKKDSISAKTEEKKSMAGPAVKAVKGLSMKQNGDKQLAINMGVTALVLLALGAYVSYSFGLKSKS